MIAVFVSRVVIDDEVDIQPLRHLGFDHIQELAKLHRAMTAMQLADDLVGLQLQRRKQ